MAKTCVGLVILGGVLLTATPAVEGQLLPFAFNQRPKILFRYGRGNWAYTNYQRFYDPNRKEFFWGWPGDYYGLDYDQTPNSQGIPPVLLLDLAGGVGWENRGHILVRVFAKNAPVWFGDWLTPQQGHERSFNSPPLEPGQIVSYQVRTRFQYNGKEMERSATVTLEQGKEVVVDFTAPPGP